MTNIYNEALPKIAKAVLNSKAADPDAAKIVECSATLQHVFGKNLKDCLKIEKKEKVKAIIKVENIHGYGYGCTNKKAKAAAARHWLKKLKWRLQNGEIYL